MLKLAIPVLHVSRSAAAEAFYCDKLGFKREFAYRPAENQDDPCTDSMRGRRPREATRDRRGILARS